MAASDGITVRTTTDRGRGVFATRALEHGAVLVRAIPAACVPSDAFLRTCCCVCLQRTLSLPCATCGAAVLCARCANFRGARLIHEDECASLRMLFAHEDRPADTRSLRLLMRLILWRWRCSQPGAPQYMSEGDDESGAAEDSDSGDGGGDWWGDGEACADTPEDLMDLCEPPDEEEWEGSAALERKLLEMAAQARYYLPAHTRLSRHLAAEIMGRVDWPRGKSRHAASLVAGGSLVGWRPWDGAWRVAAMMRGAVAAPPTLLPRRSTDPSALPASPRSTATPSPYTKTRRSRATAARPQQRRAGGRPLCRRRPLAWARRWAWA